MKQNQRHRLTLYALILTISSSTALADGNNRQTIESPSKQPNRITDIQNFDKRLPPVVPGGEIMLNGRKTRIISTAGPVPVNPVPQAPRAPSAPEVENVQSPRVPNNVSVILDERGRGKRPR